MDRVSDVLTKTVDRVFREVANGGGIKLYRALVAESVLAAAGDQKTASILRREAVLRLFPKPMGNWAPGSVDCLLAWLEADVRSLAAIDSLFACAVQKEAA